MKDKLLKLLLKIKNAQISDKTFVIERKFIKHKAMLNLLWDNGYIVSYSVVKKRLKVFIKYYSLKPTIKFLGIISKVSRRIFFSIKQLWKLNINIFTIISTSLGFKCLNDCKKMNLGGELLFFIY